MGNFSIYYKCFIILSGAVWIDIAQCLAAVTITANATSCPVTATLTALASDTNYQTPASSLLLTSSLDPTIEYLCSAGSAYDANGIVCYALKCPSANSYGAYSPRGQYGAASRGPYGQPGSPYPIKESISVGAQVASIETAYPCWKLRQLRLNTYVYIVCFVKNYPSIIYQVIFKDSYQMELVQSEIVPSTGVSAVGRVTFTTEQHVSCLVAAFSSYVGPRHADLIREPADTLTAVYHICPNNYKWYFCGNIPLQYAVDISMLPSGKNIEIYAVQQPGDSNTTIAPATSVIVHYSLSVDIDAYVCTTKLPDSITAVGCASSSQLSILYPLCGITKANIISYSNVTMLCASVNTLFCNSLPPHIEGNPHYGSFCTQIDITTYKLVPEKTVFLEGSVQASDVQYVRANTESCQFLILSSPSGPLKAYCLASVVAALNDMTQSGENCDKNPPVSISPVSLGTESVFYSAVSCSYKAKCCGLPQTCVACNRPAKYSDKYLAELICTNGNAVTANQYDDNIAYAAAAVPRNPYAAPLNPYGRPMNYTNPYGRPQNYSNPVLYGPQLLLPPQPAGPYLIPAHPYPQPPMQNPVYGVRYN